MAENGSELSPKQIRTVQALLTCNSIGEAAKAAGVGERTVYMWLKQDAFRQALTAAESDLIDAATRRLLRLQDAALKVVEGYLADDSAAPEGVRLRAATSALDNLLKLRSLRDTERRLQALERQDQGGGVDWLSEIRIGET